MKRKNYISWDEYFMGIAELSAQRSKDPKTQVGCCIVDSKTRHILSIGYNGLPYGMNDDDFSWEDSEDQLKSKHSYVVHAEANAILNASQSIDGALVYITMFPCNECAKLLAQKRVKKIIYRDSKYFDKVEGKIAINILSNAGIEIIQYLKGEEKNEIK